MTPIVPHSIWTTIKLMVCFGVIAAVDVVLVVVVVLLKRGAAA